MKKYNNGKEQLQSFYYTFGTSDSFPYKKGWVEVQAADRKEADSLFRKRFPDVHEGVLNCSSVYTKEQFEATLKQSYAKFPDWKVCHELISEAPEAIPGIAHSEDVPLRKKASLADKIQSAKNRTGEPSPADLGKETERE